MFISKTLYEKAPFYWIVLGILLIACGIYYGRAGNQDYFLAGIGGGAFACIWGLLVLRRRQAQEKRQPCSTYDEYLDQTCELNLNSGPISESVQGRPRD